MEAPKPSASEPQEAVLPSPEDSRLQSMAAALDNGEEPSFAPAAGDDKTPKPGVPPVDDAAAAAQKVKDDAEAALPENKGKVRDKATGKFIEAPKAKPGEKVEDIPPNETAFQKAQRETERQKGLLSDFEKRKQEVAAKETALAEKERQLQLAEEQRRPEATMNGYTAREYHQAALDFQKEGDFEKAWKAMQAAGQIRQYEAQHWQQHQAKATQAAFVADMEAQIKEIPDLAKPETPLAKAVETLLGEYPEAYFVKGGFSKIVKLAQRLKDADSVTEIKTKLEAAEAELTKLRDATTPTGGGGSPAPAEGKTISQMKPAEAERHLEAVAAELDQQAA